MKDEKIIECVEESEILNLDLLEFLVKELAVGGNVDFASIYPRIAEKLDVVSTQATGMLLMHLYILILQYIEKYVKVDPNVDPDITLVDIFSLIGKDPVEDSDSLLDSVGPSDSDIIN